MSQLHAIPTEQGRLPEYPDDSDWDSPGRPFTVRDDRGHGRTSPPMTPTSASAPDAVLYSCPDCGRDHFVTVDACPSPDQAAAEVATVR
jgi:hypothetical protein